MVISPDPSESTVGTLMKDADALIVRTATRITREMIMNAKRLKVISRTGGGLNNVDVDAATEFSVVVCGVKGPQDLYVAEHVVCMMGALAKHFPYLNKQTLEGNWKSRFEYRPLGLAGKRVGLIGLGRIGRIVAELCAKAFSWTRVSEEIVMKPVVQEFFDGHRFLILTPVWTSVIVG